MARPAVVGPVETILVLVFHGGLFLLTILPTDPPAGGCDKSKLHAIASAGEWIERVSGCALTKAHAWFESERGGETAYRGAHTNPWAYLHKLNKTAGPRASAKPLAARTGLTVWTARHSFDAACPCALVARKVHLLAPSRIFRRRPRPPHTGVPHENARCRSRPGWSSRLQWPAALASAWRVWGRKAARPRRPADALLAPKRGAVDAATETSGAIDAVAGSLADSGQETLSRTAAALSDRLQSFAGYLEGEASTNLRETRSGWRNETLHCSWPGALHWDSR